MVMDSCRCMSNTGPIFVFSMTHSGGHYLQRLIENCCGGSMLDADRVMAVALTRAVHLSALGHNGLYGMIWSDGDPVNNPAQYPELVKFIAEQFTDYRIILLIRNPEDVADAIVENWGLWLEHLSVDQEHRAKVYGEVQPAVRRSIALNHAMAQRSALAKLYDGPGVLPLDHDFLVDNPNAALASLKLVPAPGTVGRVTRFV